MPLADKMGNVVKEKAGTKSISCNSFARATVHLRSTSVSISAATPPVTSRLSVGHFQIAAAASCAMIITGLYTIPFFRILSSIGEAFLTLTALVYFFRYRHIAQQSKWPVYLCFGMIFLMHLLAGFNTSVANQKEFWRDIVLQLPFLLLPLSFWLLPPLPTKYMAGLYKLLLGLTTISAIGSTAFYLLHNEHIDELYIHSKVMPTVPDHIRFSLLVSLAIAVGAVLLNRNVLQGWRRWLVIAATVYLAGFLHLLAVRSGLLAFNVLAVVAIVYLLRRKQWKKAGAVIAVLIILPLLSYTLLPTYYNKYQNTQEDASRVEQTRSANNYSLVGRVYSYQVAMHIIRDHPFIGVGKGDLQQEVSAYYERYFPQIHDEHQIKPHNQFLYYIVAFGVLGLTLFVFCFYYPLWWARCRRAPLLVAQYIIVTLSFLAEYTLESQTGLTFALFFLLLPISSLREISEEHVVRQGPRWRPA
jgi:O-antigen ligase